MNQFLRRYSAKFIWVLLSFNLVDIYGLGLSKGSRVSLLGTPAYGDDEERRRRGREDDERRGREEHERRGRAEEENRRRGEELRRRAEEVAEEARRRAEEAREELRRRAEEEARRAAEELKRRTEEERNRRRAEEEEGNRRRAEEENRRRTEEENNRRRGEEERRRGEEERRRRGEEEENRRRGEEERRRGEEERRRRGEEEENRRRGEEERRRREEEENNRRGEEERRRREEEENNRRGEEERRRREEEENRRRGEEERRRREEEENRRRREEQERRRQRLQELMQRKRQLESQIQALEPEDKRLHAELDSARAQFARVDSELSERISRQQSAESQFRAKEQERRQLLQHLQIARNDIQQGRPELDRLNADLGRLDGALSSARSEADRLDRAASDANSNYRNLLAVYEREVREVTQVATNAGSQHGQTDGVNQGNAVGHSDGTSTAQQMGTEAGSAQARERDSVKGYRTGRSTGATDPNLAPLFARGFQSGQQKADENARKTEFPRGYNEELALLIGKAPNGSVNIDISEEVPQGGEASEGIRLVQLAPQVVTAPNFPSPQDPVFTVPSLPSVTANVGEPSYESYQPPCASVNQDHLQLCREVYDSTYNSAYASAYRGQYVSAFKTGFSATIQNAYNAALNQFNASAHQSALEKGATEQGVLDGYSKSLASANQRAFEAGKAELRAKLQTGHSLRFRSADVIGANDDGVLSPGEGMKLQMIVDNYGAKGTAMGQYRFRVLSASGIATVTSNTRDLPAFEADTRTTVAGVIGIKLKPLFPGQKFKLNGAVEKKNPDGTFTGIGEFTVEKEVHYPIELQAINVSRAAKLNEAVPATFTLKNMTQSRQVTNQFTIKSLPGIVAVNPAQFLEDSMEPGETVDLNGTVAPGAWVSDNAWVNFDVAASVNNGKDKYNQPFAKYIKVDRSASVLLYDMNGKDLATSTLSVQAGGVAAFQVVPRLNRTTTMPGPFMLRAVRTSHPEIKHANNSTTSITYGSLSPNTRHSASTFAYVIPQSLKGQKVWVMLSLSEGANNIHTPQVFIEVK